MTTARDASTERTAPADREGVPAHVAVIMDGNGRWAQARGLPRTEGHRKGMETVRRIIRHASRRGIAYLTLYSFSSENWRRPAEEVGFLMGLLKFFIRRDLAELHAENVRVRVIGERADLSPDIAALLDEAEGLTRDNTGLTLVIAFNYGSRAEIVRAARLLAEKLARGEIDADAFTAEAISAELYTAEMPDPDLVIRTSGEQRLSNFLMWQAAYSELVFSPVHWPDFDEAAFDAAIDEYNGRERRFGGIGVRQGAG
ncbi:MAG: isoprenyl transferase [Siculibacillus sp.]